MTVKNIQQAPGSLNFICQVLSVGHPFLNSLHRLTRIVEGERQATGYNRCISCEVCDDLRVLESFLNNKADNEVKSIPFLARLQVFSDQIWLFIIVSVPTVSVTLFESFPTHCLPHPLYELS